MPGSLHHHITLCLSGSCSIVPAVYLTSCSPLALTTLPRLPRRAHLLCARGFARSDLAAPHSLAAALSSRIVALAASFGSSFISPSLCPVTYRTSRSLPAAIAASLYGERALYAGSAAPLSRNSRGSLVLRSPALCAHAGACAPAAAALLHTLCLFLWVCCAAGVLLRTPHLMRASPHHAAHSHLAVLLTRFWRQPP